MLNAAERNLKETWEFPVNGFSVYPHFLLFYIYYINTISVFLDLRLVLLILRIIGYTSTSRPRAHFSHKQQKSSCKTYSLKRFNQELCLLFSYKTTQFLSIARNREEN